MGDPRGSVENAPLQGFEANLHNLGRGTVSFSSLFLFALPRRAPSPPQEEEEKTRVEGQGEKEKEGSLRLLRGL